MRSIDNKTSGFTLIEMLVGIVIGMIVVAAASVMMVTVLKSQKDITASARLNQELGAAMAVMSNEIRRAGFRICDVDDAAFVCPDNNDDGNEDPFIPTYDLGEDISVGDVDGVGNDGDCILYRYNANVDENPDDPDEYRGFRLNGDIIQMAAPDGNVTCSSGIWVDLTNPDVMKVSPIPGFKLFSTAGSRCRNMTEGEERYWVVEDGATGRACDPSTTPVVCTDLGGGCGVALAVSGDDLFGIHQIQINLEAELTRDSSVSKKLKSSVKVANPWIGNVP